jgi:hypothetical protein
MNMRDLKRGDVLLYAVAQREKGELRHYCGCEVVGGIGDGQPVGLSGEPITGVRAIYRAIYLRNDVLQQLQPGRILLARSADDPDEKARLSRELSRIFGPGELVNGVSCHCEATCCMPKKLL